MKTFIKLLIAAAIINACVRGAMAAWTYYQFKDAAQQTIVFGARSSPAQLRNQIMQRAVELEVPVLPQNIQVTRDESRTVAAAEYTQAVELFPNYRHPFTFSFRVDSVAIEPGTTP